MCPDQKVHLITLQKSAAGQFFKKYAQSADLLIATGALPGLVRDLEI